MKIVSKGVPAFAAVASLFLAGCSSNTNPVSSTINANAATTLTQTIITDAPADQVLSLTLTVSNVVLTDKAGATVTVLSSPVTLDVSHLDAMWEPLPSALNIPQDTYVSATFTVANPIVTYVDPTSGKAVTVNATLASATDTVTFNSPVVISATSTPLCIDLLVAQSVAFSGSTVTVTPTFNVTQIPVGPQPNNPGNGRFNDIKGAVASVSGTTLNLTLPNGQSTAVATNSSTLLQGFTALSSLTSGELVDVDVAQQTNGTLARSPHSRHLRHGEDDVRWTGYRSHGQSHDQLHATRAPAARTAGHRIRDGHQLHRQPDRLHHIPDRPSIRHASGASVHAGLQRGTLVPRAECGGRGSECEGTTITAESVTLDPQTISGTITAQTTTGGISAYTVTLPSGSALAALTGLSTVTVYVGAATQTLNAIALAVGSTVRFNGLLLKDGGSLKMVAAVSCDQPGTAPPQKRQ